MEKEAEYKFVFGKNNSSVFWQIGYKIRALIVMEHSFNVKVYLKYQKKVDISKYNDLFTFIKRKNKGYQPKKAKIFMKMEIKNFLDSAPDSDDLVVKVLLMFQ